MKPNRCVEVRLGFWQLTNTGKNSSDINIAEKKVGEKIVTLEATNSQQLESKYFPAKKLQFAITPIQAGRNKRDFDADIDTLQAPSDDTGHGYQNKNIKRNVKKSRNRAVRKQNRKSNWDFVQFWLTFILAIMSLLFLIMQYLQKINTFRNFITMLALSN